VQIEFPKGFENEITSSSQDDATFCEIDLEPLVRLRDGKRVCMKQITSDKLIERNWGISFVLGN